MNSMNTFAAYKKDNGYYGINRILAFDSESTSHTNRLYTVKGQWKTFHSAIKKIDKLIAENKAAY